MSQALQPRVQNMLALLRTRLLATLASSVPSCGLRALGSSNTRHECAVASRSLARLAVVGSGPAGFYFTDRVLKILGNDVQVDIIDKLPTPFGLVRSGVAPDHPDTKNAINRFSSIASDDRVRFFGNVKLGQDVSIRELRDMYQCVLLSYGASEDRPLGISGESLPGVLSAREFVNWYNGHPDFARLPVDLSAVRSVGVVGLGNVALDCARILLKPVAALENTDITDAALVQLRRSAVREVHIIGRRGPLQAQFSGKELRELLTLDNISVSVHPEDYTPTALDLEEPRKNQKGFAEMRKAHGKQPRSEPPRHLHIHFLRSPTALQEDAETRRLGSTVTEVMRLEAQGDSQRAVGTGTAQVIPTQLLLKSVGYRAQSLDGVPFDGRRSIVPNAMGRVLASPDLGAAAVPGLYVAGWLKRGPQGIIGTNLVDAHETAQCAIDDLPELPTRSGAPSLTSLLEERRVRFVRWQDWLAIDAAEVEAGQKSGRSRVKFTSVDEMLKVCGR